MLDLENTTESAQVQSQTDTASYYLVSTFSDNNDSPGIDLTNSLTGSFSDHSRLRKAGISSKRKKRKSLKKLLIFSLIFISIFIANVCIVRYYIRSKTIEFYRTQFLQYTSTTVNLWREYLTTGDISDYQHGIACFGISVNYNESYCYSLNDGSTMEFLALNDIYLNLLQNYQSPPEYFTRLVDALSMYDNDYICNHSSNLPEIYRIYYTLK